MPRSKLPACDVSIIIDHLDDMIAAAQSGLQSERMVPKRLRTALGEGRVKYWITIISGYKWAKQVAYQRGGHIHGEHRGDTKQARVDSKPGGGDIRGLFTAAKNFGIRYAESFGQEIRPSGTRDIGGHPESIDGGIDSGIDDG